MANGHPGVIQCSCKGALNELKALHDKWSESRKVVVIKAHNWIAESFLMVTDLKEVGTTAGAREVLKMSKYTPSEQRFCLHLLLSQ